MLLRTTFCMPAGTGGAALPTEKSGTPSLRQLFSPRRPVSLVLRAQAERQSLRSGCCACLTLQACDAHSVLRQHRAVAQHLQASVHEVVRVLHRQRQ